MADNMITANYPDGYQDFSPSKSGAVLKTAMDQNGEFTIEDLSLQALQNQASNLKEKHSLVKIVHGRYTSVASGANRTDHYQTVTEAKPGLLRIGIINCLNVPLVGLRVSTAGGSLLGADNSNDTIDPLLNGGNWVTHTQTRPVSIAFIAYLSAAASGTLSSAWAEATGTYTVVFANGETRYVTLTNAATTATWAGAVTSAPYATVTVSKNSNCVAEPAGLTNPTENATITWFDWMTHFPLDATDSALCPLFIRVQSSSSNANLPVVNWTDLAGWESVGDETTAPYGRPYRTRVQAVLGIDTPANFTSTVFEGQTIPIAIEYVPFEHKNGLTAAVIADSNGEGTGPTLRNSNFLTRVQRDLSTPEYPIEIANLAMNGATSSRFALRAGNMLQQVSPEICFFQIGTTNSAGSVTARVFTAPLVTATSGTLTANFVGTSGQYPTKFSDGSVRQVTYTNGSANVTWTGAVTAGTAITQGTMISDINGMRYNLLISKPSFEKCRTIPIYMTFLPINAAAKNYHFTDAYRVEYNGQLIEAARRSRYAVFPWHLDTEGTMNANGQIEIVSGGSTDGTHCIDWIQEKWAARALPLVKKLSRKI